METQGFYRTPTGWLSGKLFVVPPGPCYKVGGRVISDGAQIWPPCQVNLKLLAAVLHIPHAFVEPLLRGPSVGDALEEEAY